MNAPLLLATLGIFYLAQHGLEAQEAKPTTALPLTWEYCLDLALENSSEIKTAMGLQQQVKGVILQRQAFLYPQISAIGVSLPPTAVLSMRQLLFNRAMTQAFTGEQAALDATEINIQITSTEMIHKLRLRFIEAIHSRDIISIRTRQRALMENRLSRSPGLFDAGIITRAELDTLKLRTELARQDEEISKIDLENRMINLAETIGLSVDDPRLQGTLTGSLNRRMPPQLDLKQLQKQAANERLDLQLLLNAKLRAGQEIVVASSPLYPTVGAGATIISTTTPPKFLDPILEVLDPRAVEEDEDEQEILDSRAIFTLSTTWTIYDAGRDLGNLRAARAQAVKQDILLRQLKLNIPRQVDLAYQAAQAAEQLYQTQQQNPIGEESIRLAQSSFDAGLASQLEVIDAEENALQYEANLLDLALALETALTTLDRATGALVKIIESKPKAE